MLKSRNHFVPGGWAFFQPETGWSANPHVGFNEVVEQIISHRQANPRFKLSTDRSRVEAELEGYTEARLRQTYGAKASEWLIGAPQPPPVPTLPRLQRHPAGVAAVGAKASRISAGVGLMIEWLGDGLEAVPIEIAVRRASVCSTCEFNKPGSLFDRMASTPTAAGLKKLLEERAEMKLSTPHDDKLQMCSLCDCVLKLKVFAPIKHVANHTPDDVMNALPPHCWIRKEISLDAAAA